MNFKWFANVISKGSITCISNNNLRQIVVENTQDGAITLSIEFDLFEKMRHNSFTTKQP